MLFLKFLFELFVIDPNKWFDSLPEPNRFLTFVVPLAAIILTLSYFDKVALEFIILGCIYIYRMMYLNSKANRKTPRE